ncbi:MAG: quinolinate synthase NadA [Gammaproteobacteria bacterium]|nr:quinolinate synthase NadA [Gammaproteobacteria bacterium]
MSAPAIAIQEYATLSDADCDARIRAAKEKLGDRAVILGHHYQREEVYRHADLTGDSLKLAKLAAGVDAEYIVFCGVHFMAEVADIMSKPEQVAILPDMAAGCSMADMADLANVERAWREIDAVMQKHGRAAEDEVTPITYVNSAADLKGFCGRHGGICCTSTNAQGVLEWAFARREKVLFFPDQHLGRNTAAKMGISLDDMAVWDFDKPNGGLSDQEILDAKVLLWKGFCSVHQMFKPEHIDQFREKHPDAKIISHPECSYEVCQKSDLVGSTEFIQEHLRNAEPGSKWLVGTELNLVNRLHNEMKPKGVDVYFMSPVVCMCSTMFRVDPQHLCWTLENLVEGHVVNRISVPGDVASNARTALDRMLEIAK